MIDPRLLAAIGANDGQTASRLLRKGRGPADINAQDDHGRTVIHLLAQNPALCPDPGDDDYAHSVLQAINDACPDPTVPDRYGNLAAHYFVVTHGGTPWTAMCPPHSTRILNTPNHAGETPLHWAVSCMLHPRHPSGNPMLESYALLLRQWPVDVNARDDHGRTPLHWAILSGNVSAAHQLIEKGADVNIADNHGRTPLTVMATVHKPSMFRRSALPKDTPSTDQNLHQMHSMVERDGHAPRRGSSEWLFLAQTLMEAGADPKLADRSAEPMLKENASVTRWCNDIVRPAFSDLKQAIHQLVRCGSEQAASCLEQMLHTEPSPLWLNRMFKNASEQAAYRLEQMLHAEPSPLWLNRMFKNAPEQADDLLQFLVKHPKGLKSLKRLQAWGLDINSTNEDEETIVHRAAQGPAETMAWLLKINRIRESCLGAVDSDAQTALHIACLNGNMGSAMALLGAGADPTARDALGRTALHCAGLRDCDENQAALTSILVARGLDPEAMDARGNTALDYLGGAEWEPPQQLPLLGRFPELSQVRKVRPKPEPAPVPEMDMT